MKELAGQRNAHSALRTGNAIFLACDADVLLIFRTDGTERILTVVNRAEEERDYTLWLPDCKTEGRICPESAETILL